jgi:hypothetical protein
MRLGIVCPGQDSFQWVSSIFQLFLTKLLLIFCLLQDSGLLAYSLALLNNVSYNVVEFAKSQIEWMSEKLMKLMGKCNGAYILKIKTHIFLCFVFSN